MTLLLATYNLLSFPYCDSKAYASPYYNEEDINPDLRYQKIEAIIDEICKCRGILALQEVDVWTEAKLQVFLIRRGYNLISRLYSHKRSGYMGIALAIPNEYEIMSLDYHRLVDGKPHPNIMDETPTGAHFLKWVTWGWMDYIPHGYDSWKKIVGNMNFMLTAEVKKDDQIFNVSTVHMPCDFTNEFAMMTYAGLIKERLMKITGDKPYIIMGDFNILPESNCYKYLTTGNYDSNIFEGKFPPEDSWRPIKDHQMQSLVKSVHGREPDWTNYARNEIFKSNFKGTLDYIFASSGVKCIESFFNENSETDKFCPNYKEPSDHLLVWVKANISTSLRASV